MNHAKTVSSTPHQTFKNPRKRLSQNIIIMENIHQKHYIAININKSISCVGFEPGSLSESLLEFDFDDLNYSATTTGLKTILFKTDIVWSYLIKSLRGVREGCDD